MGETLRTLIGYALLAPFAHVAAAIALAPLLYFTKAENRTPRGALAGILLCSIWWVVCAGAAEFSQFAQSLPIVGLLAGASANIALLWFGKLSGKGREVRPLFAWAAIYATPAIGYAVGSLAA